MYFRLGMHLFLIAVAISVAKTLSIIPFVLPVAILTTLAAARNRNKYFDAVDMFWLLNQLAFVAAPARSFGEPDDSILFSRGVIVQFDFAQYVYPQIDLILLFTFITLATIVNFVILPKTQILRRRTNHQLNMPLTLLLAFLLVSFVALIVMGGGLANTLMPRYEKVRSGGTFIAVIPMGFYLASFWLTAIKLKSARLLVRVITHLLIVVLTLILYNPFNAPRFFLIQAWMPYFLIVFPRMRQMKIFIGGLAFGMIVLMPILSATTRHGTGADLSDLEISGTKFLGFMDTHIVMLHMVDMVMRDGYQLGSSTLAAVGFFVPRAIWPDKPIAINLVVGSELFGYGFVGTSNLSGPIIGDFYFDFGLLGLIVGSVLVALFFRRFLRQGLVVNGIPLVEYITIAALPIIFRGAVGSVIGPVAFSLGACFVLVLVINRIRLKPSRLPSAGLSPPHRQDATDHAHRLSERRVPHLDQGTS